MPRAPTRYPYPMPERRHPQAMQLVSANLPVVLPRLLPVIPALREPFYMLGSHRVCHNVFYADWCMPGEAVLRVINDPYKIKSIDGRGKVLWDGPDGYRVFGARYSELIWEARYRGFETKPTTEFLTWLKKHMHDLVQAPANAGLRVLVQSLLKPQ